MTDPIDQTPDPLTDIVEDDEVIAPKNDPVPVTDEPDPEED